MIERQIANALNTNASSDSQNCQNDKGGEIDKDRSDDEGGDAWYWYRRHGCGCLARQKRRCGGGRKAVVRDEVSPSACITRPLAQSPSMCLFRIAL